MNENIEKGLKTIEELKNKKSTIYYYALDTKGNPTAGVANIYEHVKILNELGYNASILHDDEEYEGVAEWLGEEYMELPHISAKSGSINITPSDFIVIPEVFTTLMEQVSKLPAKKIVLSQSYAYIFELLHLGKKWKDYGFNDVITTTSHQAEYLKGLFVDSNYHVVPLSIPEYFKNSELPKLPVVAIHTRDQSQTLRIIKSFYLKHPQYKWISFRDMRGLPKTEFARQLGESFLSIWVDEDSGFGTFPVESILSKTPVIGKIPNLLPEWMVDIDEENNISIKDNGIWTNNVLEIPDLVAKYLNAWFEDNEPKAMLDSMDELEGVYTYETQKEKLSETYETLITNRVNEINSLIEKEKENDKVKKLTPQ